MIQKIEFSDQDEYYNLGLELNKNFKQLFNLNELLSKDYNKIYTYKINNKLIGFIHLQVSFEEADIVNIIVDNNYRHQHIASNLIQYAKNINNLKVLNLEVRTKNDAVKFYKNLGFSIIRTIKKYYIDDDAYFMKKEY